MGRLPCCDKNGLKKGPWTPEEDDKLLDYIRNHGAGNWRALPKNAGLQRCGKSCRLRWTNYLRPDIKRGKFSFEEEDTIIHLHSILGNKWSVIASRLPGRTDNEIKNYWNTHIRKRLLRMGIDPVTHSPRLDLLDISSILSQSLYNHNFINPNSQVRMARLLGLQPLVNPEILKLASSHVSRPSQLDPNSSFTMQDQSVRQTNISSGFENQAQFNTSQEQFVQTNYSMPVSSSCDQAQALTPIDESLNQFQAYDSSIFFPNLLDTNLISQDNYVTCHVNSTFGSRDHGLMGSMLSQPLASDSTPRDSSSNSTHITTEDERESYCSNLMKFEYPADLLDASVYL